MPIRCLDCSDFSRILIDLYLFTNSFLESVWDFFSLYPNMDFPGGSDSKMAAYNAGDPGSVPGLGRSTGEGNGNPLHYSCLENPIDGEAWWATVHGVAKCRTQLSDFTFTFKHDLKTVQIFPLLSFRTHFIHRWNMLSSSLYYNCRLINELLLWQYSLEHWPTSFNPNFSKFLFFYVLHHLFTQSG